MKRFKIPENVDCGGEVKGSEPQSVSFAQVLRGSVLLSQEVFGRGLAGILAAGRIDAALGEAGAVCTLEDADHAKLLAAFDVADFNPRSGLAVIAAHEAISKAEDYSGAE